MRPLEETRAVKDGMVLGLGFALCANGAEAVCGGTTLGMALDQQSHGECDSQEGSMFSHHSRYER